MKRLLLLATVVFSCFSASAQWTLLNSGTTATLNDIHFTDANTGYACGEGGILLKTTNGGAIWTTLPNFTSGNILEVYFTDANTGWVNLEWGGLYKTTDGGQSFVDMVSVFGSLPAGFQIRGASMSFKDSIAIIGGYFESSTLSTRHFVWKKTTDGGQSWTAFNNPSNADQYPNESAFRILNADTIFLANNWLHRSVNGGQSWDTLATLGNTPFSSKNFWVFSGAGNGAVAIHIPYRLPNKYEFVTLETASGGVTPNPQGLQLFTSAFSFPTGEKGYLLKGIFNGGNSSTIIKKTTDGGRTQQALSVPVGFNALNMYFVSEALGFTCGENGVIYKTTNGGGTLAIADPSKNQPTISVFPNPATEWFTIPQSALPFQKAELFSVDGRKVKTISAGTTDVDVRGLPAGQYLLLLQKGSKTETVKVQIQSQ